METLNQGVDLDNLKGGEQILLPKGKFTVREQEVLQGMNIVPQEFFGVPFADKLAAGGLVVALVLAAVYLKKKKSDK